MAALLPVGADAAARSGTPSKPKVKGPQVAAAHAVTIETSAQDRVARPGSSVIVTVGVDAAAKIGQVSLLIATWNELMSFSDDVPPYVFQVPIDPAWSGPLHISGSVQSARGAVIGSSHLVLNVVPADRPVAIAVTDPVQMVARKKSSAQKEHINVRGTYADGTVRDVGRAELGTSFHSSDPQVVAVDAQGYLTARTPGRAVVTVRNGELSAQVPVHVQAS